VTRAAVDPGSLARARAVRSYLKARRAGRWRPTAYQVYLTVVVGAIGGALVGHAVSTAIGGSLDPRKLLLYGPALLLVGLLAAARFGRWQGPVSFGSPDVGLVLTAPIALAALVRPKLDQGLALGGLAGAILAGLSLLLLSGGAASPGLWRSLGGVAGVAAFGALSVAASWLVQTSRRAGFIVGRATPAVLALGGGLALAAHAGSAGRTVGVWSGPWGWAVAPFAGTAGWPVALAALLICAMAMGALARRRAGAATLESFLERAETRSGLTASGVSLDYRGMGLARRAALPSGARHRASVANTPIWRSSDGAPGTHPLPPRRPPRVRRPRTERWAVLWRDTLALTRDLPRGGWATLLAAAGTLEAVAHPGDIAAAGVGAAALYFAAALVCEPLRLEVDDPSRSSVLLSWPFARVLVAHCLLPVAALAGVCALSIVAAVSLGGAGAGALTLIPALVVPVSGVAVLSAALAARRGGRIDPGLLVRMMGSDPLNPVGATMIVLGLAPWLIVAVLTIGGAALTVGHAAERHHPVLGPGALAFAIAVAAATALLRVARRSQRPE
jgi:hypothetical protein